MNKNNNSLFDKSFASHPKSKFWSNKNKLKPSLNLVLNIFFHMSLFLL